jgi:hypothetical protein
MRTASPFEIIHFGHAHLAGQRRVIVNRGKGIGLIVGMIIGLLINVAGFFAFDLILMVAVIFVCAMLGWVCDLVGYIVSGNYAIDCRMADIITRR